MAITVGVYLLILIFIGRSYSSRVPIEIPDESVFHPNIKIIALSDHHDAAASNKITSKDIWTPSRAEIKAAEDTKRKLDYIDIGRNITPSLQLFSADDPIIVEIVVVLDKEFGDKFKHDRKKILDFLTVYFWDVNMRYKTLPGINISFRITGVIIIGTPDGQPFIEEARASDGRADFGRILPRFAYWIYSQMVSLPKFDMAVVITNTNLEWQGGLAYYKTACYVDHVYKVHGGVAVWNDAGDWRSLTVGAHEMAHVLGVPHDEDPRIPGGCSADGYIMSGGHDGREWFFSSCSNRMMAEFVRSNEAACLRRVDEPNTPPISSDFSAVLAPNMDEQCQRNLNNPAAFVEKWDTIKCQSIRCVVPDYHGKYSIYWIPPVDNTLCMGLGRCFRGRCRKVENLLVNVASGQCAKAPNRFAFMEPLAMTACPNPVTAATPLDKFVVEWSPSSGQLLKTPWSSLDASENGDKCVWVQNAEGSPFYTDRCSTNSSSQNPWHEFDLINLAQYGEFMLQHRISRRCAKQEGTSIKGYAACNIQDKSMAWRLL